MQVTHKEENGELEITLRFSSEEIDCLKNDLPGVQGIVDWYKLGPSEMKIAKCKERMKKGWVEKLREAGQSIPPDDSSLIAAIKNHPEYKDRQAREAEAKEI